MKLSQIGEFGLIELIKQTEPKRQDTIIGIGDDAAVLKNKDSKYLLVTTDTFVENVHFRRRGLSFFALGYKSLLANVSDIAAMGGYPTHALVTIGLPKDVTVYQVRQLYNGINSLAKKLKIDILGGDTVSSPREIIVSITLLGEVEREYLLTRSGAKLGDLILVSGKFGGPASQNYSLLVTRRACRQAGYSLRLKEARIIAKSKLATSMIDSSDGLVRSILEICKMSKTGARIFEDMVPIAKGANLNQALYGGEEYELVFTVPKNKLKQIKINATVVGEVVSKSKGIKLIDPCGRIKPLKSGGYEHFV